MSISTEVDMERIPRHIAVIMDGNGRWAKAKGLPRTAGHQQGVETVKKITEEATRLGVEYLTLYTFSTENWNRPEPEVAALMGLILDHLEDEIFMKNNVRFRVIGDLERIPEQVRVRLHECMERTKKNEKMTMVIALSYSSRWELTHAMRQLAEKVKNGSLQPTGITEESIQECLATSFMPDPDLLIRTGGELRISNYLLWQCAYSEFYFCDTYWPDFDEEELRKAIADYQSRERRFGKTGEQVAKK
ncbi:MAG: isoprenyl transferase [Paraprevotella sp.]|jgi:undecaprenyl diphosphate synthase|nr:isoprenyl transferase [Paraprevotella sp.]MBR0361324.1 isoprenyl transferase [Paraprevotella sp.]